MEDSKTLVAARELYNEQMVNALTPALIQHINTMENEARQNSTPKTFLKAIQELCRQIPQWNQHILDNEVKRILRQTEPGFLDDLLPAIFVSNAQILSSVSLHGNVNKINLKIPKLAMFIHTVYIELARKLFKQVYLFCDNVPQTQKQMNKHLIEQLAKEAVSLAVAKLLPVHDIIKACVLSDAPEDEISSQHGGDSKDTPATDDSEISVDPDAEQNKPEVDPETKPEADADAEEINTEPSADGDKPDSHDTDDADKPDGGDEVAEDGDHTGDSSDITKPDEKSEQHAGGETVENASDDEASGENKHEKSVEPTDVALPDDESISESEHQETKSDDNEEPHTEVVKRQEHDEDAVDPNESNEVEEETESANKSHTPDSPEEIVIDIGLSDDDCIRAKDEDGVLLSYDSDVNATRLQPTPTAFHPKKQAGAGQEQEESASSQQHDNETDKAEHEDNKDNETNDTSEDHDDKSHDQSVQSETPDVAESQSAVKLSSYIASPDATLYQNNDSTDLSDNDMDYNFTDDELFSDDDEVSRIIYDMKAKQTADERDTVAEKLKAQSMVSAQTVEPKEEPIAKVDSKPDSAASSMAVFLGDMAPKQVKKALSNKTISELPTEPARTKTDRRATMTKRFEKRREQQKVDPVIMDTAYNTDSDQENQSSSPRFSNLPQVVEKRKAPLKASLNRKRVTLLPDAASDSD